MPHLYALLVGIDRYLAPRVPDLSGCVNDIDDVLALLETRTAAGVELRPLVLRDGEATVAAVVDGVRTHLGRAGEHDTALFWFSGHGSQAPVPDWAWFEEPTGMLQTLVCTDSRTGGVPDLWDKELSVLLDGVAARAGHVAVVLDSCHSDGATRDMGTRRTVPPGPPRAQASLIPEVGAARPGPEHVTLSACRRDQYAEERSIHGRAHGLFTWSLLQAFARLGTGADYRELLAAARSELARRDCQQVPQLYPGGSGLIRQRFLGGAVARPDAPLEMACAADGWEINAGSAHGLPAYGDGLRVGVPGSGPVREADVVRVLTERSLVVPAGGWAPDRDRQFRVVLTAVPRPATTVAVVGPDGSATLAALRAAVRGPHLRTAGPGEVPDLTADVGTGTAPITIRQAGRDDEWAAGVPEAIGTMEHIARWRRVRELRNPVTALVDPVAVELVPAAPGVDLAPATGAALRPDGDDVYRLAYRRNGTDWVAPEIFIRLHNTTGRELWCLLLDLTSRYAVSGDLFPVAPIGPGRRGAALRGRRVRVSLPGGGPPEPGASVTDWLVLVVAERQFSGEPYLLRPLGGPEPARTRELDAAPAPRAHDWTTRVVRLVTEVPVTAPGDPRGPGAGRRPAGCR